MRIVRRQAGCTAEKTGTLKLHCGFHLRSSCTSADKSPREQKSDLCAKSRSQNGFAQRTQSSPRVWWRGRCRRNGIERNSIIPYTISLSQPRIARILRILQNADPFDPPKILWRSGARPFGLKDFALRTQRTQRVGLKIGLCRATLGMSLRVSQLDLVKQIPAVRVPALCELQAHN